MASVERAASLAAGMPGATEGIRWGNRTWFVGGRAFAWLRPLSEADLRRFGDELPPAGPLLAVVTDGLDDRDAVLASSSPAVFTIAHFHGYPAVLIALDDVPDGELVALVEDAWAVQAPPELRQP